MKKLRQSGQYQGKTLGTVFGQPTRDTNSQVVPYVSCKGFMCRYQKIELDSGNLGEKWRPPGSDELTDTVVNTFKRSFGTSQKSLGDVTGT